jgi:hypothetical protein
MKCMRRVLEIVFATLLATVSLTLATSSAVAASPERFDTTERVIGSGDVGVLGYCNSARPVPGSVPYGNFGGDKSIACKKCDDTGRDLLMRKLISAYSCYYVPVVPTHAFAYVKWV